MTEMTMADISRCPDAAPVPPQLRGTRAAIFHLLREVQIQKGSLHHRTSAEPWVQPTVPSTAPPPHGESFGVQDFLYGDRFDFCSPETSGVAVSALSLKNLG